jgi:uncharacterized radical SAM superfamily protein
MPEISTPEKLKSFSARLEAESGVGLLISGGSTSEGRVPLDAFYPAIRWIKDHTGLIVNLHCGLIGAIEAEEIAASGVDIASVDLVGSEESIKGVYGLSARVENYRDALLSLVDAGVPQVAPHVCVGLDHGVLKGEHRALEIASEISPEVIVLLGLIPTAGTPMADVNPPSAEDMVKAATWAKEESPSSEVALGCMRQRTDRIDLEERLIEAGATRITLPSKATVEKANEMGYRVRFFDGCCAIPRILEAKGLRPNSA